MRDTFADQNGGSKRLCNGRHLGRSRLIEDTTTIEDSQNVTGMQKMLVQGLLLHVALHSISQSHVHNSLANNEHIFNRFATQ